MNRMLKADSLKAEGRFRRRPKAGRPYRAAGIYMLAFILLAAGFMYTSANSSGGSLSGQERSRDLFYFLAGAQLWLIACAAPGMAVGRLGGKRSKEAAGLPPYREQAMGRAAHTAVWGRLAASMALPGLCVLLTLPVYAAALLFGELELGLLPAVFLDYAFMLFVVGSACLFFSSRFVSARASAAAAYGAVLLMYGGTGLLAVFLQAGSLGGGWGQGIALSLNPMGALLSLLNPDVSREAFGAAAPLQLWHIFVPAYTAVSAWLLRFGVRREDSSYKSKHYK